MLFDPVCPALPSGIFYVPNFITEELANALTKHLDSENWSTDLKRRVQHFGYRYDYKARRIASDSYLGPLAQVQQRRVGLKLLLLQADQFTLRRLCLLVLALGPPVEPGSRSYLCEKIAI